MQGCVSLSSLFDPRCSSVAAKPFVSSRCSNSKLTNLATFASGGLLLASVPRCLAALLLSNLYHRHGIRVHHDREISRILHGSAHGGKGSGFFRRAGGVGFRA